MRRILHHIVSWAEAYVWVPLAIAAVIGSSYLVQLLTHRAPQENIDWLVDYSSVCVKSILIICFTSIMKQATGSWMTKAEKFAHPYLATLSDAKVFFTFLAFVYLFTH